ncbi:hypothetical protein SEA_ZENON_54 [Mycobacterium phage Zenon]|uniref:Uncharacterized protein n=2 Tax=Papyrusvirus send513 TaxID=1982556 RepID=A0A2P1JQU8_9CAUD|nr:hypothetical protein SEA_ZENON_54 [Mycobacterium phage Zenon]AVO21501.1 hypothetical protein PBI_NILO_55 [Mycobacterium phage Nilo]
MPLPRGFKFIRCPECKRKGVSCRFSGRTGEDYWQCRYCSWYCYAGGEDRIDVERRRALAAANPGEPIWVTALDDDTL